MHVGVLYIMGVVLCMHGFFTLKGDAMHFEVVERPLEENYNRSHLNSSIMNDLKLVIEIKITA